MIICHETAENKTNLIINTDHIVDIKRINLSFDKFSNKMDENFIFKNFYHDNFYIAVINFDNGKRYIFWPDFIDINKLYCCVRNYIGRNINLYGAFGSAYNYLIDAKNEYFNWFNMNDFYQIKDLLLN